MAVSVKINDVTYADVPEVKIPLSSGTGDASFYSTDTDTATAADVVAGKTAHSASGAITGTMIVATVVQDSVTFAELPTPSADNLGYVYYVTDAFTTTTDFKEGEGVSVEAGTNVAVVRDGETYLFSVLSGTSGTVNLSGYYTKTQVDTKLETKQDALTAGTNISISGSIISAENTTYSAATTSDAGLMSAADKTKLDGLSEGAEANVIESIQLNGTALTVSNETVNIPAASTSSYGATKLSDSISTTDSATAATSTAVKTAYDLANSKQSPSTTLAGYGITNAYTKSEIDTMIENVESGIDSVTAVYKPQGSTTFANLPTPGADILGYVYNVTDAFTTTSSFKEGAGVEYGAGTNVAIIEDDGSYLYDALSGAVDLSGYVTSDSLHELTSDEITEILNA